MWGLLNVWQAVVFAPFENVVVCPMTHKNIDSCTGMKVSKRKIRPWRIVEIQFFRVFFVTLHSSILLFKTYVSVVLTILHAADTHRWESGKAAVYR